MTIRFILIIGLGVLFTACSGLDKNMSLKSWIIRSEDQLKSDTDSILQNYKAGKSDMKLGENWTSFSVINNIYADNSLGRLAKKAGDSTECVLIRITFYRDSSRKRQIMVAAEDSTCFKKVQMTVLDTDSTDNFIFGKLNRTLY